MSGPDATTGRVLVTGANGFTGRYLCPLLRSKGFDVLALCEPGEGGGLEADLRDLEALRAAVREARPHYLVHLAALSFVAHEPASDFYEVNLFGTLNLLEALLAEAGDVRKVVLASTANLYGAAARPVLDEDVCPKPLNHYAASKLAMEHLSATYFERLPILMTRPFNYTGPGQNESFLVPKIVSHFRRKESVIQLGNTGVARDFSDVRDIAEDYWRLMVCDASGEAVNLCSGKATALMEILELCGGICGYEPRIEVNPAFVRENEIPSLRGSSAKLESLIGKRERIPLRATLEDMLGA